MIDQLAKQLADDLNRFFSRAETETSPSESQIKALIEAGLRKLNLVTREEFDAQQAVLKRTRQKVDELEAQLAALEKSVRDVGGADPLRHKANPDTPGPDTPSQSNSKQDRFTEDGSTEDRIK